MGKKSYTQPAACTEMGSLSVAIEWEGWHGDPAGEGAGPTVHEESISQRRTEGHRGLWVGAPPCPPPCANHHLPVPSQSAASI